MVNIIGVIFHPHNDIGSTELVDPVNLDSGLLRAADQECNTQFIMRLVSLCLFCAAFCITYIIGMSADDSNAPRGNDRRFGGEKIEDGKELKRFKQWCLAKMKIMNKLEDTQRGPGDCGAWARVSSVTLISYLRHCVSGELLGRVVTGPIVLQHL